MSYIITKPDDSGKFLTINSPFPIDSVTPLRFLGYPESFDSDNYHVCTFSTSLTSGAGTTNWSYYDQSFVHCPALLDEETMDTDYFDISTNIPFTNNTGLSIYIKMNNNGLVTAVRVNDQIIIGSGFIEDPDWKWISSRTIKTAIGYNTHSPVICFTNTLTGYIYLITYYVPTGETKIKFRVLDISYASDSETSFYYPTVASGGLVSTVSVFEAVFDYCSQVRKNALLTGVFNNARFIVR